MNELFVVLLIVGVIIGYKLARGFKPSPTTKPPPFNSYCDFFAIDKYTNKFYCMAIFNATHDMCRAINEMSCPNDIFAYCKHHVRASNGAPCCTEDCGRYVLLKDFFTQEGTSSARRCEKCRKNLTEILKKEAEERQDNFDQDNYNLPD